MEVDEEFYNQLEEKLDKLFPKGKCEERGNALVLFAWAILFHNQRLGKED